MFHLNCCKAGQSLCVSALCVLVSLCCMVGQRQDNDHNNNKMRHELSLCRDKVKCLNDIWTDEHISQMFVRRKAWKTRAERSAEQHRAKTTM